jgi:hypothetical protein
VYAARVIVRAWLRCRDMKRFRALKEAWELEQSNDIIEDIIDEVLFYSFIIPYIYKYGYRNIFAWPDLSLFIV